MGLNLDIAHVAFSATAKFDGRRMRPLAPNELAQIAGRAGRYLAPGTFGVTGEARPLPDETVARHRAEPLHADPPAELAQFRRWNSAAAERLIASLERPTDNDWLSRAREADDLIALKTLAGDARGARPAHRRRAA